MPIKAELPNGRTVTAGVNQQAEVNLHPDIKVQLFGYPPGEGGCFIMSVGGVVSANATLGKDQFFEYQGREGAKVYLIGD